MYYIFLNVQIFAKKYMRWHPSVFMIFCLDFFHFTQIISLENFDFWQIICLENFNFCIFVFSKTEYYELL